MAKHTDAIRERLQRAHKQFPVTAASIRTHLDAIDADDTRLQAENERLRKALKPFAGAADELPDEHHDSTDIWEAPVGMLITAGDLRRARAALDGETK